MIDRIAELLEAGETLAVVTVIAARGSVPREPGARLILRSGGQMEGTVGGGWIEARALEAAGGILREGGPPRRMRLRLDRDAAAEEGMVCGGQVELLVERF